MNIGNANEQALATALSAAVSAAGVVGDGECDLTLAGNIPAILITKADRWHWGKAIGMLYIRPDSGFVPALEMRPHPQAQATFLVSIGPIPNDVQTSVLHIGNEFAREWNGVCA